MTRTHFNTQGIGCQFLIFGHVVTKGSIPLSYLIGIQLYLLKNFSILQSRITPGFWGEGVRFFAIYVSLYAPSCYDNVPEINQIYFIIS